jgi:hypothetical protein
LADVAQLVEQLIRNQQVVSSSLTVGSTPDLIPPQNSRKKVNPRFSGFRPDCSEIHPCLLRFPQRRKTFWKIPTRSIKTAQELSLLGWMNQQRHVLSTEIFVSMVVTDQISTHTLGIIAARAVSQ